MPTIEAALLRNKFDHIEYNSSLMSDKNRGDLMQMFLLATPKNDQNLRAKVGDSYPKFAGRKDQLSKVERREY